jgi:hypothetical protein
VGELSPRLAWASITHRVGQEHANDDDAYSEELSCFVAEGLGWKAAHLVARAVFTHALIPLAAFSLEARPKVPKRSSRSL